MFLLESGDSNEYTQYTSLASRLNGYMYSNGKSLNVALFILMADIVLG